PLRRHRGGRRFGLANRGAQLNTMTQHEGLRQRAGDAAEIADRRMWRGRAPAARGRRLLAALSAGSAVAVLLGAGVTPASARQTFIVNDPTDARDAQPADGVCSSTHSSPTFRSCTLRSAMWEATLTSGAIVLPAGVFRLTIPPGGEATGPGNPFVGDLDVFPGADIRIIGAGVRNTFIDGGNTSRIFDVEVHGALS